ncbi:MAG: tRNA adenosine(34) deaminase TadA [Candidatus Binatia bacterium]
MKLAVEEARSAARLGEVPVGAVVVTRGGVIGRGYNQRETLEDATAHAEILAIREACNHIRSWRLTQCTLYVTLEPCVMCVGAILQARIPRLVFGCLDAKGGAVQSLYRIGEDARLNHQVEAHGGTLAEESAQLLESFFSDLRTRNKGSRSLT